MLERCPCGIGGSHDESCINVCLLAEETVVDVDLGLFLLAFFKMLLLGNDILAVPWGVNGMMGPLAAMGTLT